MNRCEMKLDRSFKLALKVAGAAALAAFVLIANITMAPSLQPVSRQPSSVTPQTKTCRVVTNDVGTITGHAKSGVSAFEDAATQCFDRHDELSLERRGHLLDEEAGIIVIDQCANIKCS